MLKVVKVELDDALLPHNPVAIIPKESDYIPKPRTQSPGPGRYHLSFQATEPAPKGAIQFHQETIVPRMPEKIIGPD